MAVQIKGQSTWSAKAAESRAADEAALHATYCLSQDDEVRFKPTGAKSWILGTPRSVAADGSITVICAGKFRSVRPEALQVKVPGPRKGTKWVPVTEGT